MVSLSSFISHGLILQRGKKTVTTGRTTCAGSIRATWTSADPAVPPCHWECPVTDGCFSLDFPVCEAGGPYTLTLSDADSTQTIDDIYFGDVFLLAGQSNMELPLSRTLDETEAFLHTIDEPLIRQFEVPKEVDFSAPCETMQGGRWACATGEDLYNFSAVGFFFAYELHREQGVPVGLYQTACGGIQIEALMSEDRLRRLVPQLKTMAAERGESREKTCRCGKNNYCKFCIEEKMAADVDPVILARVAAQETEEWGEFSTWLAQNDRGLQENWVAHRSLFAEGEPISYIQVPARWENLPDHPGLEYLRGSGWLLKRFDVPAAYAGQPGRLKFGTVIDADETYLNGVLIGRTEYRYPPRRYAVPEGLIRAGENVLVVRITASQRTGGTVPEMPYELTLSGGWTNLLNGPYEFRVGASRGYTDRDNLVNIPDTTFYQFRPYGMYNKMIHPLRGLALQSLLFYQGESNVGRNWEYEYLCRAMVEDLRTLFCQPTLPFFFVGLPLWGQEDDDRGTDKWDAFREVQKRCQSIPYSAMTDIYDLGFLHELHPQNKQAVGHRLYLTYKAFRETDASC